MVRKHKKKIIAAALLLTVLLGLPFHIKAVQKERVRRNLSGKLIISSPTLISAYDRMEKYHDDRLWPYQSMDGIRLSVVCDFDRDSESFSTGKRKGLSYDSKNQQYYAIISGENGIYNQICSVTPVPVENKSYIDFEVEESLLETENEVSEIKVRENMIFFTELTDANSLYRYNMLQGKKELIAEKVESFSLGADAVYYTVLRNEQFETYLQAYQSNDEKMAFIGAQVAGESQDGNYLVIKTDMHDQNTPQKYIIYDSLKKEAVYEKTITEKETSFMKAAISPDLKYIALGLLGPSEQFITKVLELETDRSITILNGFEEHLIISSIYWTA